MAWKSWMFLVVTLFVPIAAASDESKVHEEIGEVFSRVKGFAAVDLPVSGTVVVTPEQSLTIERLRGVPLDDDPPVLGKLAKPYDPRMTDDFAVGDAPYVARGIGPFRFRYFHNEFNYGGWHNYAMQDYAATHGFQILYPYVRRVEESTHLPKGTLWLNWGGFIDWGKWLLDQAVPEGRYDRLADMELVKMHVDKGIFRRDPNGGTLERRGDLLMIDQEHSALPTDQLRQQPWYPKSASDSERMAFEKKYYDGYARTYISCVEAARKEGWKNISIYGWSPFPRMWFGLEKVKVDPNADHDWNAFGRQIYERVDIINNSVYCFYWNAGNVAYTLANIDLNIQFANSSAVRKPLRPYYWTLLHGGGEGWRWWANQPLGNEEQRAMTAMGFFTGFDGMDLWNWSGTGNHHVPEIKAGEDAMVGSKFELRPDGAAVSTSATVFERYDAIHVESVDAADTVWFQRIDKADAKDYGVGKDKPFYTMVQDQLRGRLRPRSEPVAAMIEGLALAKPFEYILRHGEVKIDVSAQEQFAKLLPIVRRVKLGQYHVLITYDPQWQTNRSPQRIELKDFDGRQGLTVVLPADSQTRIFVLKAP